MSSLVVKTATVPSCFNFVPTDYTPDPGKQWELGLAGSGVSNRAQIENCGSTGGP